MKIRALHLEDNASDVSLVKETLASSGLDAEIAAVRSPKDFVEEIENGRFDVILVDNGLPGFNGKRALEIAREKCPDAPFIFVSAIDDERETAARLEAGAAECVSKHALWRLAPAIRRATASAANGAKVSELQRHHRAMMRLVQAVQELSLARTLEAVMAVVRTAAREITGADGATFILRAGDKCHYADEEAISPLWKGRRFPLDACISGWAMLNKQPAILEDIYSDPRIPAVAYRPTFVKSLVMVPIRVSAPIGAIGNYWASRHLATPQEVELLQTLANTTAVAMENVQLYAELEQRVQDRTVQLAAANRELEAFSYSVSHDLQAPLRAISGFTSLLGKQCAGKLDSRGEGLFEKILSSTERMRDLISDLLRLAKLARVELRRELVDLSGIAREITATLQAANPDRSATFKIEENLSAAGDLGLLRAAMENLLGNAWKYSSKRERAEIEFGAVDTNEVGRAYCVRDNGAGFDMTYAERLFAPFQRLHRQEEFTGTGVGLATVQRIIHRHGGQLWADAAVGRGAAFFFTLPQTPLAP